MLIREPVTKQRPAAKRPAAAKPLPPAQTRIKSILKQSFNDGTINRYQHELSTGGTEAQNELNRRAVAAKIDPRAFRVHLLSAIQQANTEWQASIPKHSPNFLDRTARNAADMAYGMPGGLFNIGKGIVYDVKDVPGQVARGVKNRDIGQIASAWSGRHTRKTAKQIVVGTAKDLRHPLRNPGYTAMDVWGLASMGAGMAGKLRAASEAGSLPDAARAITKTGLPKERTLESGGVTFHPAASRNPIARAMQGAYDQYRNARPYSRGTLRRGSKELWHEQRFTEEMAHALPSAAQQAFKHLPAEGQRAIQVVAEGVPIDQRIADLAKRHARSTSTAEMKTLMSEMEVLQKAKRYVIDVDGKPELSAAGGKALKAVYQGDQTSAGVASARSVDRKMQAKLEQAQALGQKASARSTKIHIESGNITPEQAVARVSAPAKVMTGKDVAAADLANLTPDELARYNPTLGTVVNENAPTGKWRVPAVPKNTGDRAIGTVIGRYRGGIPLKPKTVTRAFTGALHRQGNLTTKVGTAIAQDLLRAEQYGSKNALHDRLYGAGKSFSPETLPDDAAKNWQPIRAKTSTKIPERAKALIQKEDSGAPLTASEKAELKQTVDRYQEQLFPKLSDLHPEDYKNIRFVPKKLFDHVSATGVVAPSGLSKAMIPARVINQLEKTGVLFTGPKYIFQNAPQNVLWNAIHRHGNLPGAISDWAKAMRESKRLSPESYAAEKAAVGEGRMTTTIGGRLSGPTGPVGAVQGGLAKQFGRVTDLPNRLAALRIEAKRAGIKTDAEFEKLLTDPAQRQKLFQLHRLAANAIGDYGRLTPFEKQLSDVVWFYPWLKVANNYTKRMPIEHPAQSMVLGKAAAQSQDETRKLLGKVPDWLQGVFVTGHRGNQPMVSVPTSVGFSNTPADIGNTALQFAKGNVTGAGNIAGNLAPAPGTLMALLTHQNDMGYSYPQGTSQAKVLQEQLIRNLPLVTLIQRLQGKRASKNYPGLTKKDALLQFGVSSAVPKPIDAANLAQQEWDDLQSSWGKAGRVHAAVANEKRQIQTALGAMGVPWPASLDKVFTMNLQHDLALAKLPKTATDLDKLHADFKFLIDHPPMGKNLDMSKLQALQTANVPDVFIPQLRSQLSALWGATIVSDLKSTVKKAGYDTESAGKKR